MYDTVIHRSIRWLCCNRLEHNTMARACGACTRGVERLDSCGGASMTVRMGYTMLTNEALQTHTQVIKQLIGDDPLCAWLENPLDEAGLRLRENIDPSKVVMQVDAVRIPESTSTDAGSTVQRSWTQGHLFNQRIDLRWECMPKYLHLVVITEEALPKPFGGNVAIEAIDDQPRSLLLWGTYDKQRGWSEG